MNSFLMWLEVMAVNVASAGELLLLNPLPSPEASDEENSPHQVK